MMQFAKCGAKTAGLRWDPLGRLYETTGASGTTRFPYDGDELVAEFNGTGAPFTLAQTRPHKDQIDRVTRAVQAEQAALQA